MTLYSYVVMHDTGFAPNPFFGYCTLACCKPEIRRSAQKGDWIVGLTPKAQGNRIVYYMRVDDVMESFADYWADRRFRVKKPTDADGVRSRHGDNIYEPLATGGYRQLRSMHSNGDAENEEAKAHDLGGGRVLISENFAYFGSKALPLPTELQSLVVARGHRRRFPEGVKLEFIRFAEKVGFGVQEAPGRWPEGNDSWMKGSGCTPRKRKGHLEPPRGCALRTKAVSRSPCV
jgi:hypothetical protein